MMHSELIEAQLSHDYETTPQLHPLPPPHTAYSFRQLIHTFRSRYWYFLSFLGRRTLSCFLKVILVSSLFSLTHLLELDYHITGKKALAFSVQRRSLLPVLALALLLRPWHTNPTWGPLLVLVRARTTWKYLANADLASSSHLAMEEDLVQNSHPFTVGLSEISDWYIFYPKFSSQCCEMLCLIVPFLN